VSSQCVWSRDVTNQSFQVTSSNKRTTCNPYFRQECHPQCVWSRGVAKKFCLQLTVIFPSETIISPSRVGSLFFNELGYPSVFFIPVKPSLPSCIHNCIMSISQHLRSKIGVLLYLSLFGPSKQRFHLQFSGRRNLNKGICHTPIFDLRSHIHTPSDPE
jgi:hypothetical protein